MNTMVKLLVSQSGSKVAKFVQEAASKFAVRTVNTHVLAIVTTHVKTLVTMARPME